MAKKNMQNVEEVKDEIIVEDAEVKESQEKPTIYYSLRPNDTFEILEEEFGWDKDMLEKLNPKVDYRPGKMIIIPS